MIDTDKILPELIRHFFDIDVNITDETISCRYIRTSSKIIAGSREDIDKYFIGIIATLCKEHNLYYSCYSDILHIAFQLKEEKEFVLDCGNDSADIEDSVYSDYIQEMEKNDN